MAQIFISYSRRDTDCARRLTESIKGQDLDLWIDWQSIPPTVDWWSEIQKGIERADVFLFLVSPASIRSKVCRREIDYAIRNGKRLIPVVVRDVNAEEAPSVLSHLNWIFIRDNDDFSTAFGKLITAIKTDYDWVKAHRELQVDALEWERNKHDKSYLLRGTELQLAEFQLTTNAAKEPHPTDLQRDYLRISRQAADKQRMLITSIAIGVIIALAVLGTFGWFQAGAATNAKATADANLLTAEVAKALADSNAGTAQAASTLAQNNAETAQANAANAQTQKANAEANAEEAQKQAKIAFSRQLAAQAQVLMAEQFDLALLLAIESSRNTTDGKLSLSNLLRAEPHLIRIVNSAEYLGQREAGFITDLAFSPDGNQLVANSYYGAGLWDFNTRQTWKLDHDYAQQYFDGWRPYQILPPAKEELLRTLVINDPNGTSTAVSNRAAFSTCRTAPAAGGAPGCTSLIYILAAEFNRLVTPLSGCSSNENPRGFQIKLEGGSYHIQNLKSTVDQPMDFELYSVALANKASNYGSTLSDARYDLQTNRLVTAAGVGRHSSELALIVWDLTERKPVIEFFHDLWDAQSARINFSNNGAILDVCANGSGFRVDIAPESWQAQACEMAGRNLTLAEWRQFIGNEEYRATCPQWPLEPILEVNNSLQE